ncbi:hypothetical protein Fot_01904 [Forsythia ovata]|uniref:Uncharacterized protein n=1 Tax=Forsythia ovata TaxID=205694 RepID=A0ABD1X9C5_9LAMI
MSGFYFPSVTKLKIRRREGGLWMISPSASSTFCGVCSRGHCFADTRDNDGQFFLYLSRVGSDIRGAFCFVTLRDLCLRFENSRQSGKRKVETDSREGAFLTSVPHSVERINIGFHRDELDPTVLEKIASPKLP